MQRRMLALALSAALGPMGLGAAMAADKAATDVPPHVKRVDINSASKAELKALPGVGDAEAERIIKARPFPSKAKLAVDKVIPDALYAAIQGQIVAAQPAKSIARTAPKAASKP